MKALSKLPALLFMAFAVFFSTNPASAQEYDDMYFRSKDRNTIKKEKKKNKIQNENNLNQPDSAQQTAALSPRNMNPNYLDRYNDTEEGTGYYDEEYNQTQTGKSGQTVINNYYGSDFRNMEDIYWSNPVLYRNTIYDPFYRMRIRTWHPYYYSRYSYYDSFDPWYYGRSGMYITYNWGWSGIAYGYSYGYSNWYGGWYDPFYDSWAWNSRICYPSYSYYGYNSYYSSWGNPYYGTYANYDRYAEDVTVGRRGSRSSYSGKTVSSGSADASSIVTRRGSTGGRTDTGVSTVPTRKTSSGRYATNNTRTTTTYSGRTATAQPGTRTSYTGSGTRTSVSRTYENRNLNTYRTSYSPSNSGNSTSRGTQTRSTQSNATSRPAYSRSQNGTTSSQQGTSRSGVVTKSRSNTYQRSSSTVPSYGRGSSSGSSYQKSSTGSYNRSSTGSYNSGTRSSSGSSSYRSSAPSRSSGSSYSGGSSSGRSSSSSSGSRSSGGGSSSSRRGN